jgi:Na+/pantothenate symporter
MLKKVFTNPYVIGGIVSFVILLVLGLYLEFSISESLLASAVLAAIGTVIVWWQKEGF